jgi:hypothetical protein
MHPIKWWILVPIACALWGCGPAKVSTGAFRDTQGIESRLQRGVSTADDVRRLLGEPNGHGELLLSVLDGPRQIWYYEDVELTQAAPVRMGSSLGQANTIQLSLRQQILIVFLHGGRYDGVMWSSNSTAATGWIR